jgi:hypothetical protein
MLSNGETYLAKKTKNQGVQTLLALLVWRLARQIIANATPLGAATAAHSVEGEVVVVAVEEGHSLDGIRRVVSR